MKYFHLVLTIVVSSMIMTIDASSQAKKIKAYKEYCEATLKYKNELYRNNPYEMPPTFSESCISQGSATARHGITTLQTARHLAGEFPLGLTYAADGTRKIITGSSWALVGHVMQNHIVDYAIQNRKESIAAASIIGMIACMLSDKIKFAE